MQQIDIKKLLGLIVVCFFFTTLIMLFFVQIPAQNTDLVKTFGVALISSASMIVGYYFGSSDGSARKTEIMGVSPVASTSPTPVTGNQSGFIRLSLASFMSLTALAILLCLSGCATTSATPATGDTPQILAGKSLLAVKATIVSAATATDGLCKTATLKSDTCAQAKTAYEKSRLAYDAAIDAYVLMVQGSGDAQTFTTSLQQAQSLAANLTQLAGGLK